MHHSVCSDCEGQGTQKTCLALEVYGNLCHSMNGMEECSQFKALCTEAPKLPLCQGLPSHRSGNTLPQPSMIMYFHSGFREYFLLESFVPASHGQYVGFCCIVFLVAIAYEFLISLGQSWERKSLKRVHLQREQDNHPNTASTSYTAPLLSWAGGADGNDSLYIIARFRRAAIKGLIRFTTVSISYLLMLLSMTFNIGIFLSIVFGLGIGSALTSFFSISSIGESECC
jgi:hypothetical protein